MFRSGAREVSMLARPAIFFIISDAKELFPFTYSRIIFFSELVRGASVVLFLQLPALIVPPVSGVPRSSIAPSDPSSLHPESGFDATTQLPPGTSGDTFFGGSFPVTFAGPPKHAATPMEPVIVGVIKNRKKLVGAQVPSFPPALFDPQTGPGI